MDSSAKPGQSTGTTTPIRLDAASLFVQVQWGAANQSAVRKAGAAKYRAAGIGVRMIEERFAIVQADDTAPPAAAINLTFSEARAALQNMRRVNPRALSNFSVVAETKEATR